MKLLRFATAAAALLGAALLPAAVYAQNTQITATQLGLGGIPIASGTVTALAVDRNGTALTVFAGGMLNGPVAYKGTVTAGAISGLVVPDQVTSVASTPNTPIYYRVEITSAADPAHTIVVILPPGTVTGSTFALDHYTPTQTVTPLPSGVSSSSTLAVGQACSGALVAYLSSAPGTQYECIGGHLALSPSSGGSTNLTLTTTGTGAATYSNGVLNIPTPATATAPIPDTCTNNALTINFPASGTAYHVVNTNGQNCTISFAGVTAGQAAELRVKVLRTSATVTYSTTGVDYTSMPASPRVDQDSVFHLTSFGSGNAAGND